MGTSSSKPSSSSSSRPNPPPTSSGSLFRRIGDQYTNLPEVQQALRREGLESSQLIVAIDYTKSNEWTGKYSCQGRSLHHLSDPNDPNPYLKAIGILARTLSAFDDDGNIPCYGFGDSTTGDRRVFSFKDGDQPCHGLEEVEAVYRGITPHIKLSGPTSFAPAINQATKIVAESGNQYHILLLVADGQVTRSSDMARGQLSPQEDATIKAIVEASAYPLSIIMIGVGDGPWDMMKEFDDQLPERRFDNFQFVNATQVFQQYQTGDVSRMEAQFALRSLMEIPEQFKAIQRMGLIGRNQPLRTPPPAPVPPPVRLAPPAPYPAPGFPPPYPAPGQYPFPGQPHPTAPYPTASYPPPYFPSPDKADRTSAASTQPPMYSAQNSFGSTSYADAQPGFPRTSHTGSVGARGSFERTSAASSAVQATPEALFICPITQELMKDPVIAADGYVYEKEAIVRWFAAHDTSPMTNQAIPHKHVTPNHALRSSIMEYKQAQGL